MRALIVLVSAALFLLAPAGAIAQSRGGSPSSVLYRGQPVSHWQDRALQLQYRAQTARTPLQRARFDAASRRAFRTLGFAQRRANASGAPGIR